MMPKLFVLRHGAKAGDKVFTVAVQVCAVFFQELNDRIFANDRIAIARHEESQLSRSLQLNPQMDGLHGSDCADMNMTMMNNTSARQTVQLKIENLSEQHC